MQFSADDKKFVVVLRKGNLEKNTNEYSMLLWQTEKVFRSPAPEVLFSMASSSNRAAIHDVSWLMDNETVVFLGETPGEQGELYTFNIKTRTLRKVSSSPTTVLSYSMTPNGDQIAYTAEESVESLWGGKTRREGVHISSQHLYNLLTGKKGDDGEPEQQLFLQSQTAESRRIHTTGKIKTAPLLSPDGKYIVLQSYVADFPESWKEYSDPELQRALSEKRSPGQASWVTRYELIDTITGEGRILLEAPEKSWDTEAAWSPDSRSVAISNTYLPLDNATGDEREARKSKRFTVEVNVPNGEITPINQESLKLVAWDARTNQLVLEGGRQNKTQAHGPRVFIRKIQGKWEKVKAIGPVESRPEIILEEDMNTPPRIFAVDPTGQQHALLLDLNPQFTDLKFGKVEEIHWKDPYGHEAKGGLYYPVDYVSGKKYPLVIQTHEWDAGKFWIDGPWSTAYAAQPLAGKGIMVLQGEAWSNDDEWWPVNIDTPNEVDAEVATYEGAIEYLDSKGLIDKTRLGILGFSRTCLYVKYALTHPKYRFTAASVTDGVDAGYLQYITWAINSPHYASELEGINGGPPFGQGLKAWVERSPGFNVARVHTPVHITALGPSDALFEWEWFAALTRLGRPVDMVMIEDGVHVLEKPWDRMVSQQGNVDWFAFWLKGEEDSNPSKAEQYVRWRELRKMQTENEKKAASDSPSLPH